MMQAFLRPLQEREHLTRVAGRFWCESSLERPLLVAVVLGFERDEVTLAVTDDDEIRCNDRVPVDDGSLQTVSLAGDAPWNRTIGKPIRWAWEMVNQLGYSDGVQLEFAVDGEAESVVVQLLALGSQLRVRGIPSGFVK